MTITPLTEFKHHSCLQRRRLGCRVSEMIVTKESVRRGNSAGEGEGGSVEKKHEKNTVQREKNEPEWIRERRG